MKEKMKYAMYMSLFVPLSWLPLRALYGLSGVLYLVLYKCLGYRTNVVRDNLRSCYPDMTDAQRLGIERKFYHQFCDNFVETIKLLHISDRQMRHRVTVTGTETVTRIAREEKRPIVLFLGHYCNWEWVPAVTLFYDEPKVSAQLYLPLHDKAFDRVMLKVRSRFRSISIDKHRAFRELLRMRRDIGTFMVGFIADNRTSHRLTRYHTDFLRHDTTFNPGGEEIGDRIDARYLYLDVSKTGRGRYHFEFKEIIPPDNDNELYPVTREYLRMLEATIDRDPAYWLWTHKRWI